MLDRLIDLLLQWVGFFRFWEIIDHYERAVVLRLGHFHRELDPGFHWIWPFNVERVIADNVVPRTMNLGAQSLTSKDGHQIVLGVIVTARIHDIQKAILDVENVDAAVQDSCYAEVARVVHEHTWDEMQAEGINDELLKACRKRAFTYGVEIMRTQVSDLARSKTMRLITGC
jgi:regulator of protease activity HflC (stomatin/prohibitin superfamily)